MSIFEEAMRRCVKTYGWQEALRAAVQTGGTTPEWFLSVCGDLMPRRPR